MGQIDNSDIAMANLPDPLGYHTDPDAFHAIGDPAAMSSRKDTTRPALILRQTIHDCFHAVDRPRFQSGTGDP